MVVYYVSDGYGGRRSALFGSMVLLQLWLDEWRVTNPQDFDEYGNYHYQFDIATEVVVMS